MAISRVEFLDNANSGVSSISVSFASCAVDDELVIAARWYGTQTVTSFTVTSESNPPALDSPHTGGPDNSRVQWARCRITAAGAKTVTLNLSGVPSGIGISVWRVTGADASPVDGATVGASGSGTAASVAKTTTVDGVALFAININNGTGNIAWSGAYTAETVGDAFWYDSGAYDLDAGAAGTKTIDGTVASSTWLVSAIAIKPAATTDAIFDSAIFDDAIFDTGAAGGNQTLVQNTRFTNTNTFYNGVVNVRQTLVQNTRFSNTNQFYSGQVNLRLSQAARFNNVNGFFGGQVNFRLNQGTRFNNSNQFFGGVVSLSGGTQTLVQSTRFNNTNSFFGSKVNFVLFGTRFNNTNQFFGGQVNSRLFQTTKFDNINTFYSGFVSLRFIQSTRFNNANQFFGGSINLVLQQAVRFDNANQFFGGTVSISSGPQTLVQNSRFDNSNTFYGGSIIQPGVFTTSTVYWG